MRRMPDEWAVRRWPVPSCHIFLLICSASLLACLKPSISATLSPVPTLNPKYPISRRHRQTPPGVREVSVDVECVATGRGHMDRTPCWIAAVDVDGNVLVDLIVKVDKMYSPLTEITGLTREDILERGVSLDEAMKALRQVLGSDVLLIGQSIQSDIAWLNLTQGADYNEALDIAEKFRFFNSRCRRFEYFSLSQTAYGLLNKTMHGASSHSPIEDCRVSIKLYRDFIRPGEGKTAIATKKLRSVRDRKGFPAWTISHRRPVIDGVCHFKFHRKKCFCGQPTVQFQ